MSEQNNDPLDWDTYLDTRKGFDSLRISQQNAFDKAILTISSSAIALSVIVLSTFAERGAVVGLPVLVAAWICFSIAIILNLASYLSAARALADEISALDEAIAQNRGPSGLASRFIHWTKYANVLAILSFVLGVGAFLLFAYGNAHSGTFSMPGKQTRVATGVQTRPADNGFATNGATSSGAPVAKPSASGPDAPQAKPKPGK